VKQQEGNVEMWLQLPDLYFRIIQHPSVVRKRDILQTHGMTKLAVFSDSQAAIWRTEYLEPGPGQPLARWINPSARTLRKASIETEIHWVPGHTGISGNEEADRQAKPSTRRPQGRHSTRTNIHLGGEQGQTNLRSEDGGEGQWEAKKCSKHYGYRLKGKAGSKRPIPMNSVKPLAARFYRPKTGHAPVGTYLKRFRPRDDDKCWWCSGGGRTKAQTWKHHFRRRWWWKDEQKTLWKSWRK